VKAATGEVVSAEDLGGGDVHTRISGVCDHLAENDHHALSIARRIVGNLNWQKPVSLDIATPEEPLYDPSELWGVIPFDTRKPYDVREVIARLVDGSRFDEFKARYGTTLVTGFARCTAIRWASSPTTASCSASRRRRARTSSSCAPSAASRCCSCRTSPASWSAASTRTAASPRTARRWSPRWRRRQVPKFTMIIGGSFGAGNYGMCGRAYSPRMLWMWPNARISVMGGEQAASVLSTIKRDGMEGRARSGARRTRKSFRAPIRAQYETQGHPYYATARIWDDGMIDPAQTRRTLGLGISASLNAPILPTKFGVFRM
jgi:3-methylcrotonyl-CoA carboxylase beta subunit